MIRSLARLFRKSVTCLHTHGVREFFRRALARSGTLFGRCPSTHRLAVFCKHLAFQFSSPPYRLHVGSGRKHLEGYINIDKFEPRYADLITSADRIPIPSGTADEVYTSHMIERLLGYEFDSAMMEWHRVLKTGAPLRIRCPNFELYMREWIEGDFESRWKWGITNIYGHQDRGRGLLTCNGFTVERLRYLLPRYGFEITDLRVAETRPEYVDSPEYRPDGDIICESVRRERLRVLYVDTLSESTAKSNTEGIYGAYRRQTVCLAFDYRKTAKEKGRRAMNRTLVETACRFDPDFVHLGKCESVSGWAVREIRRRTGAVVLHFYGDFRPVPQPWVVEIGREADKTLLYHTDPGIHALHRDAGVDDLGFWWVGAAPEVYFPRDVERRFDVSFMGNHSHAADDQTGRNPGERLRLLTKLADEGIDVHLFGAGWDAVDAHPHLHAHRFVDTHDFATACSASAITLGYNTSQARMYTSWRRPLNCMASGAFHLTRYFPGLETVFENHKHLVWFTTIDEAVEFARHYLYNEDERNRIAECGRAEVLAHHTWDHRIAEMIGHFHEVRSRQAAE